MEAVVRCSIGCYGAHEGRVQRHYRNARLHNEQWEQIVKNDPNAKGKRYNLFPMYKTWIELFGKDRATGESAENVMEAVNELISEDAREHKEESNIRGKEKIDQTSTKIDINVDNADMVEEEGNSIYQNDKGPRFSKGSG